MTYMATPNIKTPDLWVKKFTILVDPRNNAFSLYDLYGHALAQEPLPRGLRNLQNLVDPLLVIITLYLVCLIYAWE